MVALLASACGSAVTGGRSPDEIAAIGAAEVERHGNNPLVAAITLPEFAPIGERRSLPASANQDRGRVFGELGYSLTEFRWSYRVGDGVDLDGALDAAAAELIRRGATLDRSVGLSRELTATSLGDELAILLVVQDATLREMQHRTSIQLSQ